MAQDARKSEVFDLAARHAPDEERRAFLEKAAFFWRYTVETLAAMPTRTLTRPMVLLLGHGLLRDRMQTHPDDRAAGVGAPPERVDRTEAFEPQKVRAKRRFTWMAPTAASMGLAAGVWWLVRMF